MGSLRSSPADVVLLDLSLPDSVGFSTFEKVREAAPDAALIVLSGMTDEDLAVKTVKKGGQDYLVKGQLDSASLVRAIRYATERSGAEARLRLSELKFRSLYENEVAGVFQTSPEGRFISANPASTVARHETKGV